jgi:hypothetical protein
MGQRPSRTVSHPHMGLRRSLGRVRIGSSTYIGLRVRVQRQILTTILIVVVVVDKDWRSERVQSILRALAHWMHWIRMAIARIVD